VFRVHFAFLLRKIDAKGEGKDITQPDIDGFLAGKGLHIARIETLFPRIERIAEKMALGRENPESGRRHPASFRGNPESSGENPVSRRLPNGEHGGGLMSIFSRLISILPGWTSGFSILDAGFPRLTPGWFPARTR
jgi:hypothetical protein